MAIYEYIKVRVAADIDDVNLGDNIFPRTSVGAHYNNLVAEALLAIQKLPNSEDQGYALNCCVLLGRNKQ